MDSPDDTDNSNNSGGGGHHGGGGRHGRGGRGFPWWLYVKPPSIYDVKAGGNYDAGILKYGTRNLSVYVPPRVRYYPDRLSYLPRANTNCGKAGMVCIDSQYYVTDFWWGEDYHSTNVDIFHKENPLKHGTWQLIDVKRKHNQLTATEAIAGFYLTQDMAPESLPPDSSELGTPTGQLNASLDVFSVLGYGAYGVTQMMHTDTFYLQRSSSSEYRLIVTTSYNLNPNIEYYVSSPSPGVIQKTPVLLPMMIAPQP